MAAALSTTATTSQAEGKDWNYRAFLYLWAPEIGGTTTTGQDMTISFSDILDNLDLALMGALEANNGPISILGDFQYLNVSKGGSAAVGPGIPVDVDADVSGFVFTGTVGYDFMHGEDSQMVAFGGVRFLDLDTTANLAIAGGSARATDSIANLDAILGVRGYQPLGGKWRLSYNADVGAGESDLTMHVGMTIDYRINNWDLSVGYRHMQWDIDNSNVFTDLSFSGPIIGAKLSFFLIRATRDSPTKVRVARAFFVVFHQPRLASGPSRTALCTPVPPPAQNRKRRPVVAGRALLSSNQRA